MCHVGHATYSTCIQNYSAQVISFDTCAIFTCHACVMSLSLPVQYLSNASTLNNIVESKFTAQGKFWTGNLTLQCSFTALRRTAYSKINKKTWEHTHQNP